jgi:hypothetical protein
VEGSKVVAMGFEGNKDKSISYQEIIDQDPEFAIVSLLNAANVSVWMSSRLTPVFYNREKVRDAFIAAANRTTDFHLILDSDINWADRKDKMPWLGELLQKGKIVAEQSKEPIPHWLLVDSNHVRMEKEHDEDLSKTSNLIVWNAKDDPMITVTVQSKFDLWWQNGSPIK